MYLVTLKKDLNFVLFCINFLNIKPSMKHANRYNEPNHSLQTVLTNWLLFLSTLVEWMVVEDAHGPGIAHAQLALMLPS